jgi:hypothetical protein
MSLQVVSRALAEHLAVSESTGTKSPSVAEIWYQSIRWAIWAAAVMFGGVGIGIIGKKIIHDELFAGVGALISIAGMFWMAYSMLSGVLKTSSIARRAPGEGSAIRAVTTSLLPESREPVSSIAERTTDLLDAHTEKSKGRGGDEGVS